MKFARKHCLWNGIGADGKYLLAIFLFLATDPRLCKVAPHKQGVCWDQEDNFNKAVNKHTTSTPSYPPPFRFHAKVAFSHPLKVATAPQMAQFFQQPQNSPYGQSAQNLQFYPSSYTPNPVSGHATPSQASFGYGAHAGSPGYGSGSGFNSGFGAAAGVSGRMGEQGGLRTGWLAAFGTEGYDGEPPLLEELGVNFGHVWSKVLSQSTSF